MDRLERKNIKDNIDYFIATTDYNELLNACVKDRMLTPIMVRKIEDVSPTNNDPILHKREKHRRLFEKITQRGPTAYDSLKRICTALHYDAAVRKLINMGRDENNDRNVVAQQQQQQQQQSHAQHVSQINNDRTYIYKKPKVLLKLEEHSKPVEAVLEIRVKKSTKIHDHALLGVYPMKSELNRGVILVVNMVDFPDPMGRRNGSDRDAAALLDLFNQLKFKLFYYRNLSGENFFNLLEQLITSDYLKTTECFILALLTHGSMDRYHQDCAQFSDGTRSRLNEILKYFDSNNCPHLRDKPKIFLFPFCRGEMEARPVDVETDTAVYYQSSNSNDTNNVFHNRSDTMICYATLNGYVAHRHKEYGSWYIQEFCELMSKLVHDTDFTTIIQKVNENLKGKISDLGHIQTPNFNNICLNKKLYFNPGVSESNGVILFED